MNVTKAHLIDHLHRNHNFSREESISTIEALLEIIKHTLESGEDVLISRFGKFIVKEKTSRRGRTPRNWKGPHLGCQKNRDLQMFQ
jgi:integration host factor subunit alpha